MVNARYIAVSSLSRGNARYYSILSCPCKLPLIRYRIIVSTSALARPCLGLFLSVYTLLIFYIILVSAYSSCFTLVAPMHGVSCAGHTPVAWDLGFLKFVLNSFLYFGAIQLELKRCYRSTDNFII